MKTFEEIAALVDRVEKLADRLETQDRGGMVKSLATEVQAQSATLADLLEAINKQGPEFAKQIAQALGGLTLKAGDIKPEISVTVPKFEIPAPAAAGRPKRIVIEPERASNGVARRYVLTIE